MKNVKFIFFVLIVFLICGCSNKKDIEREKRLKQFESLFQTVHVPIEVENQINSYDTVEKEPTMCNLEFRDYICEIFKDDIVSYELSLITDKWLKVNFKNYEEITKDYDEMYVTYSLVDDVGMKYNRKRYYNCGLNPTEFMYSVKDDVVVDSDIANTDYVKVKFEKSIYYSTIKGNVKITIKAPIDDYDTLYNKVFKNDFNEIVLLDDLTKLDFIYKDNRSIDEKELKERVTHDLENSTLKEYTKTILLETLLSLEDKQELSSTEFIKYMLSILPEDTIVKSVEQQTDTLYCIYLSCFDGLVEVHSSIFNDGNRDNIEKRGNFPEIGCGFQQKSQIENMTSIDLERNNFSINIIYDVSCSNNVKDIMQELQMFNYVIKVEDWMQIEEKY